MTDMVMRVKLADSIFALAVIAIPFDAIAGFKSFGELGNESSFYFFALAMGLYGINAAGASVAGELVERLGGPLFWRTGAAIVIVIAISALWNATEISAARFHGRDGLAKLVTSATVVIYGLALALLTRAVVLGRWYVRLILPICISAALCVGFGLLEALDRVGMSLPLYQTVNSLLHAGSDHTVQSWDGTLNLRLIEGWDKRLRTVSFEPPSFGNFSGLAWPWLFAAIFITRGIRKALHIFLLLAFTALIVGSQARTGWLLLATNVVAFGLLKFLFLPPDGRVPKSATFIGALLLFAVVAVIIFYAASFDEVIREAVVGTSVSDLSRLAYQVTSIRMFSEYPILGVGLGQFAFKASSYMPDWGFLSSEVKASLRFTDAPWPNTYSLYARLAAELGLIGLFGWISIWIALIVSVRGAGLIYANLGRNVPVVAYPIIMSCADVIVTGLTTDTFRTPMIWITLGAGAAFSARVGQLAGAPLRPSTRPIPSQTYLTSSRS